MAVSLVQPVGDLALPELLHFLTEMAGLWSCVGLVWACGIKLAHESGRPRLFFPVVLICAWAVSVVIGASDAIMPGDFGHLTRDAPFDLAVYELWVNLFYGGFYTLGFLTIRRTSALRRRLAALRLSRNEAEAKLREARLKAVRGQIQPRMLLDALDALGRTYARNRRQGDELFDLLIAFLRAAMPGLRSGASTLAAELAVVDRYAALREALEAGALPWRLSLAPPPAELAFPPLRLLPALDHMSRKAPHGAAVEVTASQDPDAFVVRIGAASRDPLPPPVLRGLRSAMRQDLGLGAMMAGDLAGGLVAELRVTPSTQDAPSSIA